MYAWISFVTERNEHGQPTKAITPGTEVTQQDLGVSKDDWERLIMEGCIRDQPYPDIADNLSPAEYYRDQEGARVKGRLTREQVQERSQFQLPI
jgi:hypothetical protein